MADPYEEERHARFVVPVDALLNALQIVEKELLEIKNTQSPQQCSEKFDRTMDLLYNTMRLCKPMAMMETHKDRLAFKWVTSPEGHDPTFYWVVCRNDGTFKFGTTATQAECEYQAAEELKRS